MNQLLYWNAILLEASRRDHSQGYANGQQSGPTSTSRAMAIVHLAIHDAIAFVKVPGAAYLKKKHGITMTPSSPNDSAASPVRPPPRYATRRSSTRSATRPCMMASRASPTAP